MKFDTVEFVKSLQKARCEVSQVYGISYSVDQGALSELRGLGTAVDVPDSFSQIGSRLVAMVKGLADGLVILDVGGYACAVAERSEFSSKVRFIVEDTNNGLWQYNSINPQVPVIEVASIENKSIENAFVGRRIVDGIIQFFCENNMPTPQTGYVVVGFGGIGASVCAALSLKGINAAVADVDERKLAIAEALGHKVGKSIGVFVDARVIIGCTGKASVNFAHLAGLESPFLISGSSKRVEFEDVLVQGRFVEKELNNASVDEITGSILVNNGEPINLHYGSLNTETSDFMFANIASAIVEGASLRGVGVFKLSDEAQRKVCRLWWDCYRSNCTCIGA